MSEDPVASVEPEVEPGDVSTEQRMLDAVNALEDLRGAYQRQNVYRVVIVALSLIVGAGSLVLGFRRGDAFCRSQNAFKQADRARWGYILNLTKDQPLTPEQQRQRDQFVAFIDKADATQRCELTL